MFRRGIITRHFLPTGPHAARTSRQGKQAWPPTQFPDPRGIWNGPGAGAGAGADQVLSLPRTCFGNGGPPGRQVWSARGNLPGRPEGMFYGLGTTWYDIFGLSIMGPWGILPWDVFQVATGAVPCLMWRGLGAGRSLGPACHRLKMGRGGRGGGELVNLVELGVVDVCISRGEKAWLRSGDQIFEILSNTTASPRRWDWSIRPAVRQLFVQHLYERDPRGNWGRDYVLL